MSEPTDQKGAPITDGDLYSVSWDDLIGGGAFSKVYLGRTKAGRRVAVKYTRSKRDIEAARNEVKLLKQCAGALNIVQYIGSCYRPYRSDETGPPLEDYTFAMEMALFSLEKFMQMPGNARGLEMFVLIDLITDCASALVTLKEKKIAHRDIKHMNILVFPGTPTKGRRSTYLFKLCDLGGSRTVEDDQGMKTLVGTPNMLHPCMAEELCYGPVDWKTKESYTAEQCDLWSLGCTLYFCATGSFPFKHDNNDRSLYYNGVSRLRENPDAIAMEHRCTTKHMNKRRYEFAPIEVLPNKRNRYPKWFVHMMTMLLRGFFHEPSMTNFASVAESLKKAPRRVFLSIDQLSIVYHSDLSADRHVGINFPSLSECFDYPKGTPLMLISRSNMTLFGPKDKALSRLRDEEFLVLPLCPEVSCRRFPALRTDYREDVSMPVSELFSTRLTMIADAIESLNMSDTFIQLVSELKIILSRQFDLLIEEMSSEPASIAAVSRFSVYFETACVPLVVFNSGASEDQKSVLSRCCEASNKIGKELDLHIGKILKLVDYCKKQKIHVEKDFELDYVDLPNIKEELETFFVEDKPLILATHEYAKELALKCYDRRCGLLRQFFEPVDGKNMIQRMMMVANGLNEIRDRFRYCRTQVLECVEMLEKPFQEMKSTIEKTKKKEMKMMILKNNELARRLETEMASLQVDLKDFSIIPTPFATPSESLKPQEREKTADPQTVTAVPEEDQVETAMCRIS
ncbi:unnamed protein product [Caenorhabditis auriculariae]|uniref:IkappaB kinase n=1 Tax=Caenorhabditis auriculariae TaxID=2777116 RepID=A0A8S1GS28_9PELO|nr:unnamed protein product [Caenorhabditis auriculariae]